MLDIIESILLSFRNCFRREKSFKWFTVIISALMLRSDKLGITSVIRDLDLRHTCYECLDHFFHSTAFDLKSIRQRWYEVIASRAPLLQIAERKIILGDGVKQCKEALRMPGVKKLHQESETCSKPEYIHGHMLGAVCVVVSNAFMKFSLPLKINLQDGLKAMASWNEAKDIVDISARSHVEQMIEAGFEAAKTIGRSFFVLDRYFLTRPAIMLMNHLNKKHPCADGKLIDIITKAKVNCTAYEPPVYVKGTKGRPPKRGKAVKLWELFPQKKLFKSATATMYGKTETVSYHCLNLLWGPKLYQELRFVLVKYNGMRSILVSTDTSLDPVKIIELYSVRFGIEECFREFKQQLGGFNYHFWTKSLPKLNHFAKKSDPDPLESIQNGHARKKLVETVRAIESFVTFSSIAMGTLQLLALNEKSRDEVVKSRYLRTESNVTPSEATVMYYLRKRLFTLLATSPQSFITRYIREKQMCTFSSGYADYDENIA